MLLCYLGLRRLAEVENWARGPSENPVTESELVEGCRNGDRQAQRALYDQTSAQIYRVLLRMTRNADTAFDLAQDTFVRAFSRIGQFNGRSTLATWLYRIAVNEALQFLRREEPQRFPADLEASAPAGVCENDRVSATMDLEEVLQRMDPLDRAALVLRYQEGLDYRAMADVMGCPSGTVASRLNRARQRARELLATYDPAEENRPPAHPIDGDEGPDATTGHSEKVRTQRRHP